MAQENDPRHIVTNSNNISSFRHLPSSLRCLRRHHVPHLHLIERHFHHNTNKVTTVTTTHKALGRGTSSMAVWLLALFLQVRWAQAVRWHHISCSPPAKPNIEKIQSLLTNLVKQWTDDHFVDESQLKTTQRMVGFSAANAATSRKPRLRECSFITPKEKAQYPLRRHGQTRCSRTVESEQAISLRLSL